MIQQVRIGFQSLFTGLRLIRNNPRILRLAIVPLIIDFLVVVGIFVLGTENMNGWVEKAMAWVFSDPGNIWWKILYWPLYLLGWLGFLACLFFVSYAIANLVAAPFNSLLAETTLEELQVIRKRPFHMGRWLRISLAMIWTGLLKTTVFLMLAGLFFFVSFIPVVGLAASVGMLMIMAFDSADYTFEILEFRLSKRFLFFRQNFFYFAGAGMALGLTLLVPGLNFLLFPAAVVGSSDLVRKRLAAAEGLVKYEFQGSSSPADSF